jgi:predicted phosphoribosyltransferase
MNRHEELAFGAIAEGDFVVYNEGIRRGAGINDKIVQEIREHEVD